MIQRDITTELIEAATPDFLKGIERFRKIAGDRYSKGYVLYNGHGQFTRTLESLTPWTLFSN
jgi:hypothetical protein